MKRFKNIFVLFIVLLPVVSVFVFKPIPPYIDEDWKFIGTPEWYPYQVWNPDWEENSVVELKEEVTATPQVEIVAEIENTQDDTQPYINLDDSMWKLEEEYKKYERNQKIILETELKKSRAEEVKKLTDEFDSYNLSQRDYDTYYKQGIAEIELHLENYKQEYLKELRSGIEKDKQEQIRQLQDQYK